MSSSGFLFIQYPEDIKNLEYVPNFTIRGLHVSLTSALTFIGALGRMIRRFDLIIRMDPPPKQHFYDYNL